MDAARLAKDTPKSQKTRARILDQAMRLIAEIGYHAATNPAIADAAGLTRGAMLYHFPTREALVEAAVAHIQSERSTLFRAAAADLPSGADVTEHAIDSYWDLLHSVPFVAFAELEAAGRTDPAIHALLAPAQAEFDRAQAGDDLVRILHAGAGPRFQASRDLARFMLEGLARSTLTYDKDGRKERLLQVIKRATHMLNRKGDIQDLWPE
ncbi:TetR/AcrR family transcriptional regulator [Caulobacter sp.]|uniref:TetR/AcrR family transcriptional regulator n=1 Tax=Caulobacter sp. TaxID=78 RepID=UPI001B1BCB71|nr:TetR/AcrR family transcriptional regulator [Caulobacter sp.]MBO9544056.1 TetR/AcrR family transcriptional regulator [Caulobacter sp.]